MENGIKSQFVITVFEDGTHHIFTNFALVDDACMQLIEGLVKLVHPEWAVSKDSLRTESDLPEAQL